MRLDLADCVPASTDAHPQGTLIAMRVLFVSGERRHALVAFPRRFYWMI